MKKTYLKGLALAFAAIAMAIIFGAGTSHAAQDPGSGFTITPPIFDLKANTGDQLDEVVSVYNNASEDLEIATTIENLKPIGEVGQVQVTEEGLPSLKEWITVDSYVAKVKQGETRNITFHIKVPANAEPGGHFATVLFGTTPNADVESGGSVISQKIGTLVLLTIAGEAKESASVTNFAPEKTRYFDYQDINFNFRLQNDGNTYIHPKGSISITNIFGHKVKEIEVEGKNILPGAARLMTAGFFSDRLFGPYTANLNLIYGDSNKTLSYSAGFLVIPWKQTTIAIVIILIIVLLRKRIWRAFLVIIGKKKD